MKFTELNLHADLLKGIADAGFTRCMPVQEQTLVHTLRGKDVTVQSQTGTGKTAAFLITIFQHFLGDGPIKKKKALIVAPTRELAVQIEKEAKLLGKYLNFTIGSFYGGVGYYHQEKLLEKDVDIIIATPGRLLDLNYKGLLNLKKIGCLVIDEADRLFDMGFLPDIRRILRKMPPINQRQTMLFSATLDSNTRNLAYEHMYNSVKIEISPEQVTVDKITQEIYHVARREKMNLLLGLLKKEMPRSALIFTNMKHSAAQVAKHLEHNGYKCQYLIGDLPQKKRLKIIGDFKAGRLPFLVATDVASRGLHIDDLELIINYDLPEDCENYVHRIGRTARAGKSGKAIALACEECVLNLDAIEDFIAMKIPVRFADDDLFEENKGTGLVLDTRYGKGGKHRKATYHKVKGKARFQKPVKESKKAADIKEIKKVKETKRPKPKTFKARNKAQKKTSLEERLEYYRKKYSENFRVSQEKPGKKVQESKPQKKTLLKKISTIFAKNN